MHPSNETLDTLQHLLTGQLWTAALVEGLPKLQMPEQASVAEPEGETKEEAASTQTDERDEEIEKLQAELEVLRARLDAAPREPAQRPMPEQTAKKVRVVSLAPAPGNFQELVEPELVDALLYLLESAEPIVLAGAPGAGKSFTARCAHQLEYAGDSKLVALDANQPSDDDHAVVLFGQPDDPEDSGLVAECQGGALLIQTADALTDTVLLRLCQAAELGDLRVYLAFDDADAESRSVFEHRSSEVRELLEHRELIVPRLSHRQTILRAVLEYFLWEFSQESDQDGPQRISEEALQALEQYDFPGDVAEARALVHAAASNSDGDEIELVDLVDMPEP